MGTVPIWKQWLIIAASVLFSPLIMLAVACIFGWVICRRLWLRPQVTVGSAHAPARRAAGPRGWGDSVSV